jgi:hypothetical protein
LVFHHEDGEWEFSTSDEKSHDQIAHVHLSHVLEADPSVGELEALPRGWKAWRASPADDWVREPIPANQPILDG